MKFRPAESVRRVPDRLNALPLPIYLRPGTVVLCSMHLLRSSDAVHPGGERLTSHRAGHRRQATEAGHGDEPPARHSGQWWHDSAMGWRPHTPPRQTGGLSGRADNECRRGTEAELPSLDRDSGEECMRAKMSATTPRNGYPGPRSPPIDCTRGNIRPSVRAITRHSTPDRTISIMRRY